MSWRPFQQIVIGVLLFFAFLAGIAALASGGQSLAEEAVMVCRDSGGVAYMDKSALEYGCVNGGPRVDD